jgi:hypothetical protein
MKKDSHILSVAAPVEAAAAQTSDSLYAEITSDGPADSLRHTYASP